MYEAVTPLKNAPDFICTPLAGALGAEVVGIDVSDPLDSASVAALKAAILEHKVLAIRDQSLDPASLLAFSSHFGDVHFYPYMTGLPDQPEVFEIVTAPDAKRVFGNRWHSDQRYDPKPVSATVLYAKELPPAGGDTSLDPDASGDRPEVPLSRRSGAAIR